MRITNPPTSLAKTINYSQLNRFARQAMGPRARVLSRDGKVSVLDENKKEIVTGESFIQCMQNLITVLTPKAEDAK